jgi:hypothetical protein
LPDASSTAIFLQNYKKFFLYKPTLFFDGLASFSSILLPSFYQMQGVFPALPIFLLLSSLLFFARNIFYSSNFTVQIRVVHVRIYVRLTAFKKRRSIRVDEPMTNASKYIISFFILYIMQVLRKDTSHNIKYYTSM